MSSKTRAEIRQVTPEWASKILAEHDAKLVAGTFRQRVLNERTVRQYASDMAAGNWALTGQGISIDTDGNLLDGQHRLAAVMRANITVPMLVVWDCEPQVNGHVRTIDTMDIGKKRNLAMQLKIDGFNYYSEIGSASRILVLIAAGDKAMGVTPVQGVVVSNLMKPHFDELIRILCAGTAPKAKYSGKILAPLALMRTVDKTTADLFASDFNEMANLGKTSPVLQFQKFLERPTHVGGGTAYQQRVFAAMASALFFYANDKRVEIVKGNQEHVDWLLKLSKNCVSKIRELCGIKLTMQELQQHETV